jgi:hypothetical protein
MAPHHLMRVALVLLAVLPLAGCSDLDVVTASYNTLADARAAGAIESGRLPDGLPPGATDLREAFNTDTNARWGLFNFPVAESSYLKAQLGQADIPLAGESCDPPRRIEWWPVLLRGRLDAERIAAAGLQAYRSADGELIVLVNWKQGRAYYWSGTS